MLGQTSQAVKFYFYFTASKIGKTGLTVTADVYRISDGVKIVPDGACTEIALGGYYYALSGGNTGTASDYFAVGKTADATVDFQQTPALWIIGSAWVQNIDAVISAIPTAISDFVVNAHTTANTIGAALNRLLSFLTVAPAPASSALSSTDLANLDVAVSTRAAAATALSAANWPTALSILLQNFTSQRIANLDNLDAQVSTLPSENDFVLALLNEVATSFTTANTVGEAVNNILQFLTATFPTASQIANALPSGTVVARSSTDIDNTNITAKRGDSWHIDFSGLGTLVGRTKLYFTVKEAGAQEDNESAVQIEETAGLSEITHGSPTPVHGSITVTDVNAGDCTVYLKGVESAKLYARDYIWDLQIIDTSDDVTTLTSGAFTVTEDATRATS
jgi:hypothetical protein